MLKGIFAIVAAAGVLCGASAFADPITSPANVRSGPSPKWRVIASLPEGTDVQVIDCGAGWQRDWCEIQAGKVHGFVAAGVLGTVGNNVIVAPVQTNTDVNLYKGPGPNYRVLAKIPENTTVNQGACVPGWGETTWCVVNHAGIVGYVLESQLTRVGSLFPM
ncbi:SH3 domain-containing protein [Methylocystis sp. 9N]|uniref:SH3 domain-containing protein n=1 Tax=Methylocystis borbori TaxID=3118750 RepID=A0ABU7XKW3_9HYPH